MGGVPLASIRIIQYADAADGSGLHLQFAVAHIASRQKARSLAALMSAHPYQRFFESELQRDGLPVMGQLMLGRPKVLSALASNVGSNDHEDDDDGAGEGARVMSKHAHRRSIVSYQQPQMRPQAQVQIPRTTHFPYRVLFASITILCVAAFASAPLWRPSTVPDNSIAQASANKLDIGPPVDRGEKLSLLAVAKS